MTAPTIDGLGPITYGEGAAPVNIGGGVTVSDGLGYPGGSITFGLDNPDTHDILALKSAADGAAAGAISVDPDGTVYLGNGTGRDLIGNVDATENGQDGQPLTIHFTATSIGAFADGSFESAAGGEWTNEWTTGEGRIDLGVTSIKGHVTPDDATNPPDSGGDGGQAGATAAYHVDWATGDAAEGDHSLWLHLDSGMSSDPHGVIHGPYAASKNFDAKAGDILNFDWKAQGGTDAFDAFGYLMKADGSEYREVLNQTGTTTGGAATPWTTASVVVPDDGQWYFVFVAGSYDLNGGTAFGGSLYIDNFSVVRSPVNNDVLQAIANQVTFENTGDAPVDDRHLTVSATDGSGHTSAPATTDLTVTNVDDAPTGGVTVDGDAVQGAVLTATNDIADADGPAPLDIHYQWQRQDADGNWHDIGGANGDHYTLTQDDVGHDVRAVASYTDDGGAQQSLDSNEIAGVANDAPAGTVDVAGQPTQGETLTATNDIVDIDGPVPLEIAYQWQRLADDGLTWVNIDGANADHYTLTQDDVGHQIRSVASYTDGAGEHGEVASDPTAATVNVNDSPVAHDDSFSVAEDTTTILDVLANDVDIDGDTRTITHVNGIALANGPVDVDGGSVALNGDGQLVFTPDAEFNGHITFDYTINDGHGETSTGTTELDVTAVNDAPVTAADSFTATADGASIPLDVLANDTDADGDIARITQIDGRAIAPGGSLEVAGGLVTLNEDGTLAFVASLTFDGTAHFTYTADDGHGGETVGTVTGDVTASQAWGDFGDQLDAILPGHGLEQPGYVNNLLAIASVVSPGAFNLADGSDGTAGGYHAGLGFDLTSALATPDADALARSLAALISAQDSSDAPGLLTGDDQTGFSSATDQSLLFQSKLGAGGDVLIDFTDGHAQFSDGASVGWSAQLAQLALRADFSPDMVAQLDGREQGSLHQVVVDQGAHIGVNIGGENTGAPQAVLSNAFGMADFVTADGNSAVQVARAVAVAATVDGSDDQSAIVRMRQGGTLDLHVQFYKVDDFTGSVDGLRPGDAGYAAAAEAHAYHTADGATSLAGGGFGQYSEGMLVGINHDDLIAMKLSNGTDEFFAFAQANETVDGQNVGHLWSYGMNTWGWEDLAGGGDRDFNDLIVQLDFTSAHHDQVL
ncbi:MAG TPA: Ig-like domain-containing protein [Roseomonas sp.]|jgi:hypothetical protein